LKNKDTQSNETHTSQINTLVANFGKISINSYEMNKMNVWIVDSGARDHVSCSLNNFSYMKIEPLIINLPNKTQVTATHTGSVRLKEN